VFVRLAFQPLAEVRVRDTDKPFGALGMTARGPRSALPGEVKRPNLNFDTGYPANVDHGA
jgi:hypothetical protein